jgi:hypothetical protein
MQDQGAVPRENLHNPRGRNPMTVQQVLLLKECKRINSLVREDDVSAAEAAETRADQIDLAELLRALDIAARTW